MAVGDTYAALDGGNSSVLDTVEVTLDKEVPVDLPIKLLKINAGERESAILKGARRLLEHRCIDFVLIANTWNSAGTPMERPVGAIKTC